MPKNAGPPYARGNIGLVNLLVALIKFRAIVIFPGYPVLPQEYHPW
jgi:hypothetical protein